MLVRAVREQLLAQVQAERASLCSADPGDSGANELPGAARVALAWDAPVSGARANAGTLYLPIAAGQTGAWVALWTNAGAYMGALALEAPITAPANGYLRFPAGSLRQGLGTTKPKAGVPGGGGGSVAFVFADRAAIDPLVRGASAPYATGLAGYRVIRSSVLPAGVSLALTAGGALSVDAAANAVVADSLGPFGFVLSDLPQLAQSAKFAWFRGTQLIGQTDSHQAALMDWTQYQSGDVLSLLPEDVYVYGPADGRLYSTHYWPLNFAGMTVRCSVPGKRWKADLGNTADVHGLEVHVPDCVVMDGWLKSAYRNHDNPNGGVWLNTTKNTSAAITLVRMLIEDFDHGLQGGSLNWVVHGTEIVDCGDHNTSQPHHHAYIGSEGTSVQVVGCKFWNHDTRPAARGSSAQRGAPVGHLLKSLASHTTVVASLLQSGNWAGYASPIDLAPVNPGGTTASFTLAGSYVERGAPNPDGNIGIVRVHNNTGTGTPGNIACVVERNTFIQRDPAGHALFALFSGYTVAGAVVRSNRFFGAIADAASYPQNRYAALAAMASQVVPHGWREAAPVTDAWGSSAPLEYIEPCMASQRVDGYLGASS